MPCKSDHLEPTSYEKEKQKAAGHLVWLMKKQDESPPVGLKEASKHIYGQGYHKDPIVALCDYIREKGGTPFIADVLNKNLRTRAASEIMAWWLKHIETDLKRLHLEVDRVLGDSESPFEEVLEKLQAMVSEYPEHQAEIESMASEWVEKRKADFERQAKNLEKEQTKFLTKKSAVHNWLEKNGG